MIFMYILYINFVTLFFFLLLLPFFLIYFFVFLNNVCSMKYLAFGIPCVLCKEEKKKKKKKHVFMPPHSIVHSLRFQIFLLPHWHMGVALIFQRTHTHSGSLSGVQNSRKNTLFLRISFSRLGSASHRLEIAIYYILSIHKECAIAHSTFSLFSYEWRRQQTVIRLYLLNRSLIFFFLFLFLSPFLSISLFSVSLHFFQYCDKYPLVHYKCSNHLFKNSNNHNPDIV